MKPIINLIISLLAMVLLTREMKAQDYTPDWATYIGGSGDEDIEMQPFLPNKMVVEGDYVYVTGYTLSNDLSVTDGSHLQGDRDIYVAKYNKNNGSLIYLKYIGGSSREVSPSIDVENGKLVLVFTTASVDLPKTIGNNFAGGPNDHFVMAFDPNGNVIFSRYWGASDNDLSPTVDIENGKILLSAFTYSSDFPTTAGTAPLPGYKYSHIALFSANDGALLMSRYIYGIISSICSAKLHNNKIHCTGNIFKSDTPSSLGFTITDGSSFNTSPLNDIDLYISKYDLSGNQIFGTIRGSSANDWVYTGYVDTEGNTYLVGSTHANDFPVTNSSSFQGAIDFTVFKVNDDNTTAYSTYIGGTLLEYSDFDVRGNNVGIINGNFVFFGVTASLTIPGVSGTNHSANTDAFYTIIDNAGNVIGGRFIGGSNNEYYVHGHIENGLIAVSGGTYSSDLEVTDGSVQTNVGNTDIFVAVYNNNGLLFGSILGCQNGLGDRTSTVLLNNGCLFHYGFARCSGLPVINGSNYAQYIDAHLIKYGLDPNFPLTNNITPLSQSPCLNGFVEPLVGNVIKSPDGNFTASYQWQKSTSSSGPWTDIPNATLRSYIPSTSSTTYYYRRVAISKYCAASDTVSFSNTAVINGSTILAPTVDAGGVFYACSSAQQSIGGSPTATGGTSPYTYAWDFSAFLNNSTIPNPIATVTASTIFTLTVTDALGCKQLDQAVVNVPVPNAGADKTICPGTGTGVVIGTPGLPVSSGITYSWSPTTGLSCATCPQPVANPGVTTTYTLTMIVPIQLGGTCTLTDQVTVNVVSPPTANFAGPDQVICYRTSATLGISTQSGYTYTWAPGKYLSSYNTAQPVFNSNPNFPTPNPITYYCTMQQSGCSFIDEMKVYVQESNSAGTLPCDGMASCADVCGPRIIGRPDKTPNINETFSWLKLSGDGNITGSTSTIQTTVGATTSGTTVYELTSVFMGNTCKDTVIVPTCGSVCLVAIGIQEGCPAAMGKHLFADGNSSAGPGTITWSPCVGITPCTGNVVELTDNVPRTYTATFTSSYDPSFTCSTSINTTPQTPPSFTAQDPSFCNGGSAPIGQAAVGGYTYEWNPTTNLSCNTCSNPTAMPTTTTNYTVTVTDTGTQCTTTDVATVTVATPIANAGPDQTVCSSSIVQLGTATPYGFNWTYSWSPPNSPWENGTNQFSAQPEVTVATTLEFSVTVTDAASGCTDRDTIMITVDDTPPPANAGTDVSRCSNGSPVMIGTPAQTGISYSWSPSTGLSCTDCAQPMASPSSTQTYTLTVMRDAPTCSSSSNDMVTVTVNNPTTFSLGGPISYCPASGPVNIGNNAPAGMQSYLWTPGTYLSNSGVVNPTTTTPVPMTYTLTVSNSFGCTSTSSINVTITGDAPEAGASGQMCLGDELTLGDASNDPSATWTPTAGLSCSTCAQPTFTPTAAGSYTFTVTQNIGGCSISDEVTVNVNSQSAPSIPNPPVVCQNSCIEIGFEPIIGQTYAWTPATGLSDPYISNPTACVSTSNATYTLVVTNSSTGCTASASVTVGVAADPAPSVTVADLTICGGENGEFVPVVTPIGTYNFVWTPATGLSDATIENPAVYGFPVGERFYNLQVTNPATNCYTTLTGIKVNVIDCIILTGKVWNDFNGTISLDGTEAVTNAGGPLYVYLIDEVTGLIVDKATIGTNGEYSFPISTYASYQLVLSTSNANIGDNAPLPSLPSGWINTGENKDGNPESTTLGKIFVSSTNLNIYNQDFGIEQIPTSVDYTYTIATPDQNTSQSLTTSNSMSPISGSDPEDGPLGTGSDFRVTSLAGMNGNTLWYDNDNDGVLDPGEELTAGEEIKNYNPSLLKVKFTGVGSSSFTFNYVSIDEANQPDPTPAFYTVSWGSPLPVELVEFKGKATNKKTSLLEWKTASEVNCNRFTVQHLNGLNQWVDIGTLTSKGDNSTYTLEHKTPMNGENNYRLKIVDNDASSSLSRIVMIKFTNIGKVEVFPNPTTTAFVLRFEQALNYDTYVRIFDDAGKIVHATMINKGTSIQDINISNLASGMYQIQLLSNDTNELIKLVKN